MAKDKKTKKQGKPEGFHVIERGVIVTPANDYLKCLEALGIKFQNDLYRGIRYSIDNGKTWSSPDEYTNESLYITVQQNCVFLHTPTGKYKGVVVSASDRNAAISYLAKTNLTSPLEDWFSSLETVDKPYYADIIISAVFDPDFSSELREHIKRRLGLSSDDEVNEAIKRYCYDFCCLVGKGVYLRTMKRGTPWASFQFMPTLVGAQGCGKGTWIRGLLPEEFSELIGDGFNLNSSSGDLLENCQKHAIMECAELEGYHKKEISAFKAFVGGEKTSARKVYGRTFKTYHRHFVIICTTNDNEFLAKDPTGTRRWVVMPVGFKTIGGKEWTKEDVKNKMLRTMRRSLTSFWGYIKYLVEIRKEDASYESWSAHSLKIREILCEAYERYPHELQKMLLALLTPKKDEYDKTEKLNRHELVSGILLDTPPSSTDRSIITLLPRNLYSKDMIAKVMKDQGWTKGKRVTTGKVKRYLYHPPKLSKHPTVEDVARQITDKSLSKHPNSKFSDAFTGEAEDHRQAIKDKWSETPEEKRERLRQNRERIKRNWKPVDDDSPKTDE